MKYFYSITESPQNEKPRRNVLSRGISGIYDMFSHELTTLLNAPSLRLLRLAGDAARMCVDNSLTLATAESCTGGLISKTLTDLPGSSAFFLGGVAAYANSVKESALGVSALTLADYGAVSFQTAAEMARGARLRLGADIGISTTGVAGPGGGSPQKPVGTVYVGISTLRSTRAYRLRFPPQWSRARIRRATAEYTLRLLLREVGSEETGIRRYVRL